MISYHFTRMITNVTALKAMAATLNDIVILSILDIEYCSLLYCVIIKGTEKK